MDFARAEGFDGGQTVAIERWWVTMAMLVREATNRTRRTWLQNLGGKFKMHSIARIGTSSHGRRAAQEFFPVKSAEPCVGETLPQANAMVSNTRSCSKTGLAYSRFF